RGHQVVIDPQAAHGVVRRGKDAHRHFVRIFARDALVHFKQVAITLGNLLRAQPLEGFRKIEIDAQPRFPYAAARVAYRFGRAGSNVARHQVAKARIACLQVIVALLFRNGCRIAFVARLFGNPNAAVVAQRFGHQRQFGLIIASDRNARGVNLREARIREQRPAFVRTPDCRRIAPFGVCGKIEDVAVTAGGKNHRIAEVHAQLAIVEASRDDSARLPVNYDQVEHFRARIHLHGAQPDLPLQGLIGAEQKLLPGLAARVKGPGNLRSAERAIVQQSAVLSGERHALRHALVDDVYAYLRQAVNVGFARAKVPAFHRVVKQPVYTVAVVVIVLCGVDASLRSDGMRATRRILEAKTMDVVTEFSQASRRGAASKSSSNNDDVVFALVGRVDQLQAELMRFPGPFDGPAGRVGDQFHSVSLSSYWLDEAGQHRDWNRDISHSNQDRHDLGYSLNPWRVHRVAVTERLKHAPQPVIQVVAQQDHGNDVEQRSRPELKSGNHVVVDVVLVE